MKRQIVCLLVMLNFAVLFCSRLIAGESSRVDMTELMKESLVYLSISSYGYEQSQPWKHKGVSESWACGCAVGEYEILTTALSVKNAAFIKVRRYAQNEFINAKIKVVDYESNLCLIELDANTMTEPLEPLVFTEDFRKGGDADFYWLSSGGHLYSGRGYLDRAKVYKSKTSYARFLNYVVANTSRHTAEGQAYCIGSEPVGIACWSNNNKETGLIPAEVINRFLIAVGDDEYKGVGMVGFAVSELSDPAMRSFLKMPVSLKKGVYVSDVYNIGTGSDVLKQSDVILKIDDEILNSYGRFLHAKYGRLYFHHLITNKAVGDTVLFDLWRDGEKIQVRAEVKNFEASDMLVPYYEYDRQPEYVIMGGFILQKLTRSYLAGWGDGWPGKVSPHLYHYYRDLAFKPTDDRRDIVILSYVLPANINLGYKNLGQLVVEKFNGMTVRSIADILTAQRLNPDSKYDVIEFELDKPVVVIPRKELPAADMLIGKNYGIDKFVNVNQ